MKRDVFLGLFFLVLGFGLASCGSSDDKQQKDPSYYLELVKTSGIGEKYSTYPYFDEVRWSPSPETDMPTLVQFDGRYHKEKIIDQSCSEYVKQHGQDAIKDLDALQSMSHNAVFAVDNGEVIPRYNGWTIVCTNGVTRHFEDEEMHSLKEIIGDAWYTDCESLKTIVAKSCESQAGGQAPAPGADLQAPPDTAAPQQPATTQAPQEPGQLPGSGQALPDDAEAPNKP